MSQKNVETVHRVFEAWNRRDFNALLLFADKDFEFHMIGGFEDLVGEKFDREGVLRLWRDMAETLGGKVKVERAVDLGERVAVILVLEGVGVESGAPGTLRSGQVWSFRDGRVLRVDSYYKPVDALQATGLSE